MDFDEFYELVRKEIGWYGGKEYWRNVYESLHDKSAQSIVISLPSLAIDAIASDMSKYG